MTSATESRQDLAAPVLQPVLGVRCVLGIRHVLLSAVLAAFFLYLNYIPLFHSDIWGHVLLGQWIMEHGEIPQDDPFMPLAQGMKVVDSAWLSQVVFALVETWGGPHFMSNLFAVVVFATYLVYARAMYLMSGRWAATACGLGLLFFVGFSRHAIIRPEIFGGLCMALLIWLVVRLEPWRSRAHGFGESSSKKSPATSGVPGWLWGAMPLLFAVWANAHGSFAVGLVFLGCHALGSFIEAAWRTRSLKATLSDSWVWRWTFLTELAVVGSLVNPYGLDLLIATAQFGRNPNLSDVLEWFPLKLIDWEGLQYMLALVLVMVLLRHSRQRIRPTDVVLMLLFGFSVAPTVRMIGWLAPVLALTLIPHITDVLRQVWPRRASEPGSTPESAAPVALTAADFRWTLISIFILWCGFSLAPISQPLLGGKPREDRVLYSRQTPLALTAYLKEHPPQGLLFAPQWWGDWMVWDGPRDAGVFMTTNIHLAPNQVWRDYLLVARGEAGWETILDRYNVQCLVVHKELQKGLSRESRQSRKWRIVYEDDLGLVLNRRDGGAESPREVDERSETTEPSGDAQSPAEDL